jgi:hypothetical protein
MSRSPSAQVHDSASGQVISNLHSRPDRRLPGGRPRSTVSRRAVLPMHVPGLGRPGSWMDAVSCLKDQDALGLRAR